MSAYQRMLFEHKTAVLLLFLGITAFFAYHLAGISVGSRTQMWFKKDDPYYIKYKKFKQEFGNDHLLVLGFSSETLFYDEMGTYIKQVTKNVRKVEGIQSVTSIFDFDNLRFRNVPLKKIIRDFFLSDDRKATQIIVHVSEEGSQFLRGEIIKKVQRIVQTGMPQDCEVHFSGSLFMGAELDRYARDNAGKAILFTIVGIFFILLFIFRKFSFAFSVLLTSMIAVVWAMGFYAVLGHALNLVTNMITPLVLIISIAVGIHIINRIQEELRNHFSWKDAIISGVSRIWRPCFLTSLTSSIGFFSLFFSPSKAIAQFGLYAALAMLFEFFVFFHVFPLILHSVHRSKPAEKDKNKSRLVSLLDWNVRLVTSHKNSVILISIVATSILALGVFRIKVNTNQLKYFSPENEIVKSARFFDEHFGGVYPIQAVLVSSQRNKFQDQETLKKILDFQIKAAEELGLKREISLADIFFAMSPVNFPAFSLRNSRPEYLNRLADQEFKKTVVSFRTPSEITSKEMMEIQTHLKNMAGKFFEGDNISVELTGIMPLYAHFHEYIIKTQIFSFSIAFILIFFVIGLTFRSFFLVLAVAFSNITSIIMIFGLMGFLGINLDAGTVMIASCAIGVIVDDTIHILHRTGLELKKSGYNYKKAIGRTLLTKGRALITTSVTIGLGFLVLLANDFKPAKFFGILMAFTMFSALLGDMILLPSLICRLKLKIK